MAQHKCVRKCYYRDKIWDRGDVLVSKEDEVVPRHFILLKDAPVDDADGLDEDPKTMSELQAAEEKALAESGADPTTVPEEELEIPDEPEETPEVPVADAPEEIPGDILG